MTNIEQQDKDALDLAALGYNMRPVELVAWEADSQLVTLRMPAETLSALMDVLDTIYNTWHLQDETAIGHPPARIKSLSDQLDAALTQTIG